MRKYMRKIIGTVAAFVFISASVFITGCDTTQQKLIAQGAGIVTAATWRGVDNPSTDQIASMKIVVAKIQEACCTNNITDTSYYARVYPLVDEYITNNVKAEDQVMCRLGAAFILTGLDTAFAANPAWKKNADKTTDIIGAYCSGIQIGLGMSSSDTVIQAATRQTSMRVKMKLAK